MDEIWHFVGSAALVLLLYLLPVYNCFSEQRQSQRRRSPENLRLLLAGTATLAIGMLKEILQATNAFPWCHTANQNDICRFDGWNLLFDVNGATAAVLYIIAGRNLCCSMPQSDAATVTSTVASMDEDDKDEEHIIIADFSGSSMGSGVHGDAHDFCGYIQDGDKCDEK